MFRTAAHLPRGSIFFLPLCPFTAIVSSALVNPQVICGLAEFENHPCPSPPTPSNIPLVPARKRRSFSPSLSVFTQHSFLFLRETLGALGTRASSPTTTFFSPITSDRHIVFYLSPIPFAPPIWRWTLGEDFPHSPFLSVSLPRFITQVVDPLSPPDGPGNSGASSLEKRTFAPWRSAPRRSPERLRRRLPPLTLTPPPRG